MRQIRPVFLVALVAVLSACSSCTTSTTTSGTSGGSSAASAGTSSGSPTGGSSAAATGTGTGTGSSTGSATGSSNGAATGSAAGTGTGSSTGAASTRVAWIPDYYGQTVHVLAGTSTDPVTLQLPASCTPNSVVVNGGQLYVACSAGTGASGATSDQILIYGIDTLSALIIATPGSTSSPAPAKTISDGNFNSLIGMTFDSLGDLWVASYGNSEVLEITAASLASANPASTVNLLNSPSSPVALAFDSDGSLWITGQYLGGILLNFTTDQQTQGAAANPRYCMVETGNAPAGCQSAPFLGAEGLALFNGDVWVANNDSGADGKTPGREIFDIRVVGSALSLIATYGSSTSASLSPIVCPGGLFATPLHLWVNDESYGEANPQCGANGDVAAATGGIFDFTLAQLESMPASQAPVYTGVTGRPGFGGIFIQND